MDKKIGRNDPCPCGSGKKYKQCCWKKEQSERAPKDMKLRSIKALGSGLSNIMSNIGEANKKHKEEPSEKVEPPESSESLEP